MNDNRFYRTADTSIPYLWTAEANDIYVDNACFGDHDDGFHREPLADGTVRFYHTSAFLGGRRVAIPQSFHAGKDMTPDQVRALWREIAALIESFEKDAYAVGRAKGRDEIRGIVRDLVGPETARNVTL